MTEAVSPANRTAGGPDPGSDGGSDGGPAGGSEPTPAVTIAGVRKRFGSIVAVNNVSLQIPRGEFFSLLGPSGCGKTTLLRMIAGFEAPDEGTIAIEGRDMRRVPPNKRPSNMVFQDYALFPHLSVADNVGFGLRETGTDRREIDRRVREALSMVHLDGLEDRRPDQMSGGQRQRVALARALVNEPVVLLLDEPLGALDLKLRKAMQLELKRIQRDVGITFIYVTHDQDEALTMSDRIAVMNRGRVEQLGDPERIYDEPRSLFVAGFIGDANLLGGDVRDASGGAAVVTLGAGPTIEVPLRGSTSVRSGRHTVLVRPEHVQLGDDGGQSGWARVEGTLVEAVYQGPVVRYLVELTDEQQVVAAIPKDVRPDLVPGDRVIARWRNEHSSLLEGAPEDAPTPEETHSGSG
jgi:spermidine/putrescine transport system ATP-binding protein